MKKTLSLIAIIILLVLMILILGYKLIVPDNVDSFVENNIPSGSENVQGDVNLIPETTVDPTADPIPVPTPSSESSADDEEDKTPTVTATPTPSATPTPLPSETPSPTPEASDEKTEYEKYMELSGEEQQEVFESFEKPQDFFDWYNKIKEEYDEKNQSIIVDGGSINLEDYVDNQDGKTE